MVLRWETAVYCPPVENVLLLLSGGEQSNERYQFYIDLSVSCWGCFAQQRRTNRDTETQIFSFRTVSHRAIMVFDGRGSKASCHEGGGGSRASKRRNLQDERRNVVWMVQLDLTNEGPATESWRCNTTCDVEDTG
jgi:hypothetical protein